MNREINVQMSAAQIQETINLSAAEKSQVIFQKGIYHTGTLTLPDNASLFFRDGAVLEGSADIADYSPRGWRAALIRAENACNISILGNGIIDGSDCCDSEGEEGFRGPHAVYFNHCKNIKIESITIQNAGNYGIFHEFCENVAINSVAVLAGHDGIHLQGCKNYIVNNCKFYTGDDSVAGSDNEYMEFADCDINSSCNGFRFGGAHIKIHDIKITSPGKYAHKISQNNHMDCAFIYFSPKDRNCKITGTDWSIENVSVNGAKRLYSYDYETGIWQDGKPLVELKMRNITASGLTMPLEFSGDREKKLSVSLDNITLSYINQFHIKEVLEVSKVGSLNVNNLKITCDE